MILGLRCSNSDYAYVVLGGTREKPTVIEAGFRPFPKNQSRMAASYWFYQELNGLLDKHRCTGIVIRGSEVRQKDIALVERVEHEAMAYPVAGQRGIKLVVRKIRSTLAKDLGQIGKATYLSRVDCSAIEGYYAMPPKVQEAALCAWSEL